MPVIIASKGMHDEDIVSFTRDLMHNYDTQISMCYNCLQKVGQQYGNMIDQFYYCNLTALLSSVFKIFSFLIG